MNKFTQGLLTYNEDNEISSSKFWFTVANIVITILYVRIGWTVSNMENPALDGFAWLTLVFAGVVAANKFASKFLDYKYSGSIGINRGPRSSTSTNITIDASTTKQIDRNVAGEMDREVGDR